MAWGLFRKRRITRDARQLFAPRTIFPTPHKRPSRWTKRAKTLFVANAIAAGALGYMVWPKSHETNTPVRKNSAVEQVVGRFDPAIREQRVEIKRYPWTIRTPVIQTGRIRFTTTQLEQLAREQLAKQQKKIKPLSRENIESICTRVQNETGIDKELLKAFLYKETSGDPTRVGSALELGWFQLKPQKIVEIQNKYGYVMNNPQDPYENAVAFAHAMRGYVDSARRMMASSGEGKHRRFFSVERKYLVNQHYQSFDELPRETQIQLIAAIHNRGTNAAFESGIVQPGIYDPLKISQTSKYAQQIIDAYTRKDYSYAP